MVIARKIAYNVAISSVSKVFSTVLALVSIGFITRYLGKEGFGNYATVLAFLSFFASLADLGLYHISTREISRLGANQEKIIGNIFSLRLISSTAVFIISPLVVLFFDYPPEVKKGIIIVAASFIFSSGYQILNGVFQKNLATDRIAAGELIGKIIQVATVIIAVKLDWGFDWIVASLLLNMAASFFIILVLSRKYTHFYPRFDVSYWKSFLRESMPIGAGALVVFAYFKMDTILLSIMKTSAEVGVYNVAYKILENITFFPAMIMGLIFPIMSGSIFDNEKKFRHISNKVFKLFVILVVPIVIGTLFLANEIVTLIGGGQFYESAPVLRVLIFALAAIFFGAFFNNILIAGNKQKKLFWIWSTGAVFNIALNLLFIPKFSYIAAACISVATELLVALLAFLAVYKNIQYKPVLEKKAGIFFAGTAMALFLAFFKELNFILLALGGSGIYFILLWLFKTIKTTELASLISKKGVEEYEELS